MEPVQDSSSSSRVKQLVMCLLAQECVEEYIARICVTTCTVQQHQACREAQEGREGAVPQVQNGAIVMKNAVGSACVAGVVVVTDVKAIVVKSCAKRRVYMLMTSCTGPQIQGAICGRGSCGNVVNMRGVKNCAA